MDVKVILEGIKLIRRIAETDPLKSFLIKSVSPEGLEDLDDEALMNHVAASAETIYHPVGTCKIGKESAGGVVDSDLRVHGIKVRPVLSLLIVEDADPAVWVFFRAFVFATRPFSRTRFRAIPRPP